MKIKINSQTYIVRIQYDEARTLVSLFNSETPTLCVGFGTALCSVNDRFCKATGRKIAFGRALKDHGFSKDERRQAWEQFFEQVRIGKGQDHLYSLSNVGEAVSRSIRIDGVIDIEPTLENIGIHSIEDLWEDGEVSG